jgi:hypothetical protein
MIRTICQTRLKKSLLSAVTIESALFFSGIYTGAISRGPHDPTALVFALSQVSGIILMGPITFVLSEVLAERHVNALVWTGVFLIQAVWFAILLSGLPKRQDQKEKGST